MVTDFIYLDLLLNFIAKRNNVSIDNIKKRSIRNHAMVNTRDLYIWLAHDFSNDLDDLADILIMKRETVYKSRKRMIERLKTDKELKEKVEETRKQFYNYAKIPNLLYQ